MISVDWVGDSENYGYKINIPFYQWAIIISVIDGSSSNEKIVQDIEIVDKEKICVTDKFLMFKSDKVTKVNPTGKNLYQVMDVLKTNLKERNGQQ